ncbi:MAG TPA: hypothetical protein VN026_11725 [Bacteroidia bacterium]|jgi:hypothetical protein|nr:hypothetical protein [Bacteroidia bacterium]
MFFCKNIEKLIHKSSGKTKLEKELSFVTFDSAEEVQQEHWNEVSQDRNIFLDLNYLKTLDSISRKNFQSRYVIIYNHSEPYAIAYFQVIDFQAGALGELLESKVNTIKSKRTKLFENYIGNNKDEVLMRLLTCGNNIVSGEHAFLFKDKMSKQEEFKIIEDLIERLGSKEKLRGKVSAVLVKDFESPLLKKAKCFFSQDKYIEFSVEPNMVVDIPEKIKSVSEYIALFSKKYRNRAKGILKHASAITVKTLNFEELKKENKNIYKLYEMVYNHAKFKLVKLPENYFLELKKSFPDKFSVTAFYYNEKMVAFSSGIEMSDSTLEAHYIGFDYELNKEIDLYQNILYNFLEQAFTLKKTRLNLGRTAGEIKSTIGAYAQELTCYIKPQNTVSRMVLKPFISFLQPSDWVPRNPFKEESLSY